MSTASTLIAAGVGFAFGAAADYLRSRREWSRETKRDRAAFQRDTFLQLRDAMPDVEASMLAAVMALKRLGRQLNEDDAEFRAHMANHQRFFALAECLENDDARRTAQRYVTMGLVALTADLTDPENPLLQLASPLPEGSHWKDLARAAARERANSGNELIAHIGKALRTT